MIIKAQEGKVFRRIADQVVFSNEIDLGYTFYIENKKLDEPLLELPEHFEEIDDPNIDNPFIQFNEQEEWENYEQNQ